MYVISIMKNYVNLIKFDFDQLEYSNMFVNYMIVILKILYK